MTTMQTSLGAVSYTDEGSGPPVVLLHAALHDRTDYAPVVDALANGRRVIALDWPGHGESPLPATPLRAVEVGDLAVDFADRLDLHNAVIVGNSVGGYAACRLALERPERVAGVVLVNTGGFTPLGVFTRLFCAALGRPAVIKAVFPAFVRGYMRAKESDGQGGRRPGRRPRQDRRGCADRSGAVEELHRTRTRPAHPGRRHQGTGADHLGRKRRHRPAALGQGRPGRHSRLPV